MPKGDNPNSRKNLEKGIATRFRKGDTKGKREAAMASNKKQAENRRVQDYARVVLNTMIKRKTGDEVPLGQAGCEKMGIKWVETGDPKYGLGLAQLAGEVKQKVEQVVITPEVDFDKLAQLRKALMEEKDDE